MSNLQAFIAMGGYGSYVWPCYVMMLVAFIALGLFAHHNKQRALKRIADKVQHHDARL